jgi:hypothetical protein
MNVQGPFPHAFYGPELEGHWNFLAGEALEAGRRVKIKSGTITSPPEVEYADDEAGAIGTTIPRAAQGAEVMVRLHGGRVVLGEALISVAIAAGTALYAAADGKYTDAVGASNVAGAALWAASLSGDLIEILT